MRFLRVKVAMVLCLSGAGLYFGITGCSSNSCVTAVVNTSSGQVCGEVLQLTAGPTLSENKNVYAYKGIPFAEAPLGNLRFMPPVEKSYGSGIMQATTFSPICPQSGSVPAFFEPVEGVDEDCLTLNVWVPQRSSSASLPVMLWIHGGEYIRHGSGQNGWDGRILAAREDVVVVSINYRLGALGFLYDAADGIGGNLGLKDQQLAMQWVQNNIAKFGGDPTKVTIFGWSAGSVSVDLHTLSIPSSRAPTPLFRGMISQSGPITLALQDTATSDGLATLATQANAFREAVCPGVAAGSALSCLQSASVNTILDAQASVSASTSDFLPIVDNDFLTVQPIQGALNGNLNIPSIIGTNLNEGNLFAAQFLGSTYVSGLSQAEYEQDVNESFGADASAVLAQPAYTSSPGNTNQIQYQTLLTDYQFGCVNRYLAQQASNSIYVYVFQELPNVNVNWDQTTDPDCEGATCIACEDAVCHADEHPFMWNSLEIVDNNAPIPDPLLPLLNTQQQTLANAMQDYWGNFAKNLNPGTVNENTWPSFATQGEYQVFGCEGDNCTQLSTTTTVPYNSCDFWDTQIGYEGLPPS